MKNGFIYILKNPSFPDYVKIGYADNVEERVKQLNGTECTPFAFRIYATYEVESRLLDKKIHTIIDKLNPNLRSIDEFNGQKRVREFYAMSAEDAYEIFEAIAAINGRSDKLKKWKPTDEDMDEENLAEEIILEKKEKHPIWTFDDWQIPVGAELHHISDPEVVCTVASKRKVEYQGELFFMTPFARKITGNESLVHGPGYVATHFKYNEELIENIEKRLLKLNNL